jgi:ATP/maltotriose-dependent transcriptional regulator MalT
MTYDPAAGRSFPDEPNQDGRLSGNLSAIQKGLAMRKSNAASAIRTHLPANPMLQCTSGAAMFSNQAWEEIARNLKLSARELQIVRGVFDDRTEFTIASDLSVSPHTIHTYCERLYHKLAVTDRVRLILRVVDEFLLLTSTPETVLPPICANRVAGRCPLRHG